MEKKQRGSFTGRLGFVLAAAGSAIGLGNLWRFPYLAAKNGGGLFILVYIILSFTFGSSLMTTEIAIGRKTGLSPLEAYGKIKQKFKFLGVLATIVPIIIFPYYCVIGGWVTKYAATYAFGQAQDIYSTGVEVFFNGFITANISPIFWFLIFMGLSAVVVLLGVEKGIEKASKIIMPALFVLIIGIAIYSMTLSYTDPETGETRTALDGLKIYLIPSFEGLTISKFFAILLDATSQLFYSLSIAMGILITYGSYCRKEDNLVTSVNQIEIFDTGIALLAGLIVVPTVFAFQGYEGLEKSGPSLMFVSLPTVFEQMGSIGSLIGALFFILVLFAALTSSISLLETIASSIIDKFGIKRSIATLISFIASVVIGIIVCLGYNVLDTSITLPNGAQNQKLLDLLDYISNSLMLPIVALLTCLLVWCCKPKTIIDEVKSGSNEKFRREKLYIVMIKYIAPILLATILLQAFNFFSFLDK